MPVHYLAGVGHFYRYKEVDRVTWGRYKGHTGVVDSAAFQRPASALREELIGVDGAVTVGVYAVLEDDQTVPLPPVAELRGGFAHVEL